MARRKRVKVCREQLTCTETEHGGMVARGKGLKYVPVLNQNMVARRKRVKACCEQLTCTEPEHGGKEEKG